MCVYMYVYIYIYIYNRQIIRKETNLIFYKLMRVPRLFMENLSWIRNKKYVKESSSSEKLIYKNRALKSTRTSSLH